MLTMFIHLLKASLDFHGAKLQLFSELPKPSRDFFSLIFRVDGQ
jgi:hypothetical protein